MAKINFPCPHCTRLVVLEDDSSGKQVTCPHCLQPVLAPTIRSSPDPDLNFAFASPDEEESIFGAHKPSDDALFGSEVNPRIEIPSVPSNAVPQAEVSPEAPVDDRPRIEEVIATPGNVINAGTLPPVSLPPSEPIAVHGGTPAVIPAPATPAVARPEDQEHSLAWESGPSPDNATFPTPGEVSEEQAVDSVGKTFALTPPSRKVHRGMRSGLFIALVLIPLVSYSILSTVAVIILYRRPAETHPLEMLPDLEGELKGAKRQKQGTLSIERVSPDVPLSAKLRIRLGQALRLGDVEVTPKTVELRRLQFTRAGLRPEPSRDPALVLGLSIRNVSRDVVFSPMDPYFVRRWKSVADGSKPYSFLQIGSHRFYGGPLSPGQRGQNEPVEEIEGQVYKTLGPGDAMTAMVCSDPEDRVEKLLRGYAGTIFWRVQVRRGLVHVGERDVSATAVVGVEFSANDVVRHES